MKRILHLTLYKVHFDRIKSGEKKTEYRDAKPYWIKRLYLEFPYVPKEFDEVHMRNGYGKHRPLLKVKHKATCFNKKTYKIDIHLGDIID